MALDWTDSLENIDWEALSALYRAAPLGDKKPAALATAFSNSMFRWFVHDAGRVLADRADCAYLCDVAVLPSHQGMGLGKAIIARLVDQSCGHKKIILYAVPGKEPLYRKLGFRRMNTAMAIFEDQAAALERGLINET